MIDIIIVWPFNGAEPITYIWFIIENERVAETLL